MSHAVSIGEAVRQFLRENNLEKPLSEQHISDFWKAAVGSVVVPYTKNIEIKDTTLFVKISNAALRNELFMQRFTIVRRINEQAGYQIINDLRLS